MYCYQCEQTAKGIACTTSGVCGKKPETAALQDLLIHTAKGVSMYAHRARTFGAIDHEADVFVIEALFTTVTRQGEGPVRGRGPEGRRHARRAS
jgi:hydroxylamine reductase